MEKITFSDLKFETFGDGEQAVFYFENGLGVSVEKHSKSYENEDNLYELAILDSKGFFNSNSNKQREFGYLNKKNINKLLFKIQNRI